MTALKPIVLLIGGGNMGRALLGGWHKAEAVSSVTVVDPQPHDLLKDSHAHKVFTHIDEVQHPEQFNVVVLAIKPQVFDEVLPALKRFARQDTLFLSIAAGKSINTIAKGIGHEAAIVRAMPNTPALIGHGIAVCANNNLATAEQRAIAKSLLSAVGEVLWTSDEKTLHAVTALSGSGPAYVFALIEAMQKAGEKLGLSHDMAARLARRTVEGSGALAAFSPDKSPADLRHQVTSPGGTTEAALRVLHGEKGLCALLTEAIEAAARRSQELASGN